ncbi:MAG: asparaginase [Blastocatellia bacterium]|nr:asparaginase [Blastocatellia bacterium]
MRKRVYIVYTGGTIGMNKTPDGYAPAPGFLAGQMVYMPELRDSLLPEYIIHEYAPLLDSANISPHDWLNIANDIAAHHDDFDGFVVLHGTDTMAYTASALPFLLQELKKPVILTGSQIPLCEIRNDARENLITSLIIAANYGIPEVCIYFGGKLLRGCRSVKVHANGFQAFASPNYPPLGTAGIHIDINWNLVLPPPTAEPLAVRPMTEPVVGALRLFPGISAAVLKNVLQPPLKGLVLETFGVGNGPDTNQQFLDVLKEATDRGVVVVATTQCLLGSVGLGEYKTGSSLAKAGVISGHDMTAEAALAKLFYLFSANLDPVDVKNQILHNLRGELTPPKP